MDNPKAAGSAGLAPVMRLPVKLALDLAERSRPGVGRIYTDLLKAHPNYNWRLVLRKAKEDWDAAHA